MYLGSDALALAPVHRPHRLSRGRGLGRADPRDGRTSHDADRQRSVQRHRPAKPVRQPAGGKGQLPPLHGEGDLTNSRKWSATRSPVTSTWRRASSSLFGHGPPTPKQLKRVTIVACGTAYYAGLVAQILDRALRAPACRDRCRLGIPLSRGAGRQGRTCASSSRNRARPRTRWPRCAMRKERGARTIGDRQRRRTSSDRAANRCDRCRRSLARRSASPRPRPSPASSPCWRAWRSVARQSARRDR